jgi:LacI family transcriptional regulator, galactose operon repressor
VRRSTIAAVAAEAGVGVGTVSRVLNGSPSVSEDTRRRVLEAIATLDYQPSAVARALSTGRTHAVAVVAPFFTQPSVVERLRGMSRTLSESRHQLILIDVERPEQRRDVFRSASVRGRYDALLTVSLAPTDTEARRLAAAGVPLVLIDRAHPTLPAITVDDVAGGRLAAEHLLALGHRDMAFLGDEAQNAFGFDSSANRQEGFAAALAEAGHELRPERVILRRHGREAARAAAMELLASGERPSAIFATSDMQAIGVLEAAQELGLRVPEDVSVIGFDDVEAATYVRLTTVAQPLRESGALGARMVLRRLAGEEVESVQLDLQVVDRGSTAAHMGLVSGK